MELVVIIKSITTATENKKKRDKIQNQLQNKSKDTQIIINIFSWISAVNFNPFLIVSHSLPPPPRMPFNTGLVSAPAVGAAQTLIRLFSCSCLQCPQVSELGHFPLWELSLPFYIFHKQRICLVYQVDLISTYCSCGEVLILFLSHTVPKVQLWLYFHFWM